MLAETPKSVAISSVKMGTTLPSGKVAKVSAIISAYKSNTPPTIENLGQVAVFTLTEIVHFLFT